MFWVLLITAVCILVFIRLVVLFKDQINFFMTGQDKGFKFGEVVLLWKLAKEAELDEPSSLYMSVPTLNRAISKIVADSQERGDESSEKTQEFIAKLYDYRTQIDLDHENHKGIESTKYLEKGQRLRIILRGSGVFMSEILSNGHDIIIRVPVKKGVRPLDGKEWVNRDVSVYLWRKGDAGYVFDTRVTNAEVFQGQSAIHLAHTNKLERAQKRKSVRGTCQIYAQLYFLDSDEPIYDEVEVTPGYTCLLEDISEDGALIRTGGKGQPNIRIKIQFDIDGKFIVMFGIVRAVEYNQKENQSRLHFECLHIETDMKNAILNFIYKDLSEEKKEVLDALAQTEEDEKEEKQGEGQAEPSAQEVLDSVKPVSDAETAALAAEITKEDESDAETISKLSKDLDTLKRGL